MDAILKSVTRDIPGLNPGEIFQDEKTVLEIPLEEQLEAKDLTLFVQDIERNDKGVIIKNDTLLFRSGRSGQITRTDNTAIAEVPEDLQLEGKEYKLHSLSGRRVIASGKIACQAVPQQEKTRTKSKPPEG